MTLTHYALMAGTAVIISLVVWGVCVLITIAKDLTEDDDLDGAE